MQYVLVVLISLVSSVAAHATDLGTACDAFLGRDISFAELMSDADDGLARVMPRTYLSHLDVVDAVTSPPPDLAARAPVFLSEPKDTCVSVGELIELIHNQAKSRDERASRSIHFPGPLGTAKSPELQAVHRAWQQRLREHPNLRNVSLVFRDLDVFVKDGPNEIEIERDEPIRCLPREWQRRILERLNANPPPPFEAAIARTFRRSENTRFTFARSSNPHSAFKQSECGLEPRDLRLKVVIEMMLSHYFPGPGSIPEEKLADVFERHLILRVAELDSEIW